jgi:predicted HAD superfamily Cof-like phosphohydrolase
MNKQYEQVREFHKAFDQTMPDQPMVLGCNDDPGSVIYYMNQLGSVCKNMKTEGLGGDVVKRASWMLEELIEFMDANDIEAQVDALTDLIYFAIGTFTLLGVKPEAFFDIVHAANMGKLHEDGKPRFDGQGKIVKPAGWEASYAPEPKIIKEVKRQIEEAHR